MAKHKAVFLDKDGTLFVNRPYNVDPARIKWMPGAVDGIRHLYSSGYKLVVISNQGGMALGHITSAQLLAVEQHIKNLFEEAGAPLTAFYYCPHRPDGVVSTYTLDCDCRKPKPGLIIKAAFRHQLDLSGSWMVGDILDDVEAGHRAGCRSILVDTGGETEWRSGPYRAPDFVASSLLAAAKHVSSIDGKKNEKLEGGSPWQTARRILAIRLDSLGDVLMMSPALRALKETLFQSQLTLLTSESGAKAASLMPEIDECWTFEAPWMKATPTREGSSYERDWVERVRARHFDAAVIFTSYSQSPLPAALLCFLADIPLRLAHCRENPYQLLTHWVKEKEPEHGVRHEVRRQLDLVATVGAATLDERLRLSISQKDLERSKQALESVGLKLSDPWVVIHPGASAPSRRYPAEGFVQVAELLAQKSGWQIVFTGERSEIPLVRQIQSEMRAPSKALTGELSTAELAGVISQAPLLVSNNTGPAHLAAAVGTPVVDLYALTNPQHTPWMVRSRVLYADVPCKYCYKSLCPLGHNACLRSIDPVRVAQAAQELISTPTSFIGETACLPLA